MYIFLQIAVHKTKTHPLKKDGKNCYEKEKLPLTHTVVVNQIYCFLLKNS